MATQILRATKLKTVGNVTGSLQHMLRQGDKAPNADPARSGLNINSVSSVSEALHKFRALEPEYKQKNNVEAIEFLVTASPEFFQDEAKSTWRSYLDDGLEWIKRLIGAKNIVATSIQLDETTPHLSVIARPIVDRRFKGGRIKTALSAKRYLDGSVLLSKMQDRFHDDVAIQYDLERGVKGSKAKHQTVQSWYGEQAGSSARVKKLEQENAELRARIDQEQHAFDLRLIELNREITSLKGKEKRWRKRAAEISASWFSDDIEKSQEVEPLKSLKVEVEESDVLPRSAKANLIKTIDKRISDLTIIPPEPTRQRGRRRK